MAHPEHEFRDQLLASEPLDPQRQKQLEQQVRDLVSRKITGLQWVYWATLAVGGVAGAWFFGRSLLLGLKTGSPLLGPRPEFFTIGMWLCMVLSLAGTALAVLIMLRRRVDSRLQLRLGKLMPAVAFMLIVISFLYGCDDPGHKPEATWLGVYALAAFVFTSSINLWNRIVAADQNAQSQMLRIEYRLAELAERLAPPQSKQ